MNVQGLEFGKCDLDGDFDQLGPFVTGIQIGEHEQRKNQDRKQKKWKQASLNPFSPRLLRLSFLSFHANVELKTDFREVDGGVDVLNSNPLSY